MAIQTSYAAGMAAAFVGQIADTRLADVVSRLVEPASIGFGLAVIQGTAAAEVKLGAAGVFRGLTVRDITLPVSNGDVYKAGNTAGILTRGSLWVTAVGTVAPGNPVYRSATGTLSATSTNTATAAAAAGNTGNGVMTLDATTPVLPGAKAGVYQVRAIAVDTNAATLRVTDPDGFVLGDVTLGATFANDIKFVVADGATDFVVGDGFDVTVTLGSTLIEGARWETAATNGNLARVHIQ